MGFAHIKPQLLGLYRAAEVCFRDFPTQGLDCLIRWKASLTRFCMNSSGPPRTVGRCRRCSTTSTSKVSKHRGEGGGGRGATSLCLRCCYRKHAGDCENYGSFLGTLNIRGHIIIGIRKRTIILITTQCELFMAFPLTRQGSAAWQLSKQEALMAASTARLSTPNRPWRKLCKNALAPNHLPDTA